MGWGTERFFEAFARHEMVGQAWHWPVGRGVSSPFLAEYRKPDVEVLGDVIASDHMIEFERSAVDIRVGDQVFLPGKASVFRVSKPVMAKGNGDFAWAEIEPLFSADSLFNPALTPWGN
jgi:hypothetical protein